MEPRSNYYYDLARHYLSSSTSNISALLGAHGNIGYLDDNQVNSNLPSVQVDYLSHNWNELDVWESWKAMTKHKADMVDGMRLENASWRRWAQQRNNLSTVNPKSLNWLKESDVTWLYGPLHQGGKSPMYTEIKVKKSTPQERLGLEVPTTPRKPATAPRAAPRKNRSIFAPRTVSPPLSKPKSEHSEDRDKDRHLHGILKHRTLSEMLSPAVGTPPLDSADKTFSYDHDSDHSSMHIRTDNLATSSSQSSTHSPSVSFAEDVEYDRSRSFTPTRRHISFALPES